MTDISLSTNATQLFKYADDLYLAGVNRINVSLDSLDKACMLKITGSKSYASIMAGLQAGKQAGFKPIKSNMVVMRGVNDHEILRMPKFCFEQGFILRLIEAMPIAEEAHSVGSQSLREDVLDCEFFWLGTKPILYSAKSKEKNSIRRLDSLC